MRMGSPRHLRWSAQAELPMPIHRRPSCPRQRFAPFLGMSFNPPATRTHPSSPDLAYVSTISVSARDSLAWPSSYPPSNVHKRSQSRYCYCPAWLLHLSILIAFVATVHSCALRTSFDAPSVSILSQFLRLLAVLLSSVPLQSPCYE